MEPEDIQALGPVRVLLGPTAGGKTRLSLLIGERANVEIVSVDSMQVYRGMDIGTAKVSAAERRRVPHHMIDVVEPEEHFSAARFCEMACGAIRAIRARGRAPLLVCGTPFYLKALLWGMFEGPGAHAGIRRRLTLEAAESGVEALHRRLETVDPEAAARIDERDFKRIERALEVYELTGRPITQQQGGFEGPPRLEARIVGLRWPRAILHERIERRVDEMVERGLSGEVSGLRERLGPQASQAVGYKELISHFDGETGLEDAVELVKRNTRRLAKDQIGWFKRFPVLHWYEMRPDTDFEKLADRSMQELYI